MSKNIPFVFHYWLEKVLGIPDDYGIIIWNAYPGLVVCVCVCESEWERRDIQSVSEGVLSSCILYTTLGQFTNFTLKS